MAKTITKAELVKFLKMKITTDYKWGTRCLIRIYDNQLSGEKGGAVLYNNGIGFTVQDARILSQMAQFFLKWGHLTPHQMAIVNRKIGKYANQLMHESYFDMEKLKAIYIKSVG